MQKSVLHITGLFTRTSYVGDAAFGGSGYVEPQVRNRSWTRALCAVFLRHILARRNATHCFAG
jgi:hypothetical protein